MTLVKHSLVVGPFQCNCSILVCEKTKQAIVIDPGDEFHRIQKTCTDLGIQLKYALHTHAHLDHIGASGDLKKWQRDVKICLHQADEWLFQNLQMQGQLFGFQYDPPPAVDQFLNDEETFMIGEHSFSIIHTPGHSPGGVCFRFQEGTLGVEPVVFSGDTLFQHSIGRTDLWGGDFNLLIKSIKDRLLTLDDQTVVFPGHGPRTTIGIEAKENPFL